MRLFKNLLSLTGAELVSKLVTFAAFAYLARVAGPDGFGFLEFAGSVLLCASLIVDQGFNPYGAREIAKAPQRTAALVSEILLARCVLAIAAYAVVLTLALVLNRPSVVTRLLLIYGLSLLAMPFLLQWVFQGHDRMPVVATAQVIRQTVFAAVTFLCVRGAEQIWVVAVAEVAGVCSAAAYTVWMYRRQFGGSVRPRLPLSRELWRDGVPIGLSQMFWVVRMFGATLIVGLVAAPADLGFFAGAQRILVALHSFVWLYFFNLLPSMARAWEKSPRAFADVIDGSFDRIAWVAAAVGLTWVAVAPAVMTSVYGAAFAPAGSTLQWLAPVFVIAAISGHYRFGLIATGHQDAEMVTAAVGAVMAMVLIPIGYRASGPSGAAMGLCATELGVWMSTWWCGRHILGLRHHAALLIRPLLGVVVVCSVLWSVPLQSRGVRVVLILFSLTAMALVLDGTVRRQVLYGASIVRRQLLGRISPGVPEIRR